MRVRQKNALKYPVKIGDMFGVHKVIEEIIIEKGNYYETKWKTININTGKEYISRGSYLYKLKDRVENKFYKERQLGLRKHLYRTIIRNANNRKHIFNLTFDEYNVLIKKSCYYCGEPPKEVSEKLLLSRGDTHQPKINYNGVDRLNPNIGYVIYNCVPCCSVCNYMKHTSQEEDFLKQVEKIYKFKIKK